MMKVLLTLVFLSTTAFAGFENLWFDDDRFPINPVETVTPGVLCEKPDSYRYAERIPYCERDVQVGLKEAVIREYDRKFGFEIQKMNRQDFKIDHYIPLCMGGANARENLWPQHKSVYVATDLIEQRSCELMAKNRLLQNEAVSIIKHVKNHLEEAEKVLADLNSKLR